MTKPLREWVGWDGGPLIAIPAEIARHWRGISPPSDASAPKGWIWGQPGGPSCDYDRACGVSEYSGVLNVGPGQAFILADGTMMTAFLPLPDGGMFVGWGHADSVREARRAVSNVPDGLWQPTGLEWRVVGSPILVFTAAAPGDSIPEGRGHEGDEHVEVDRLEVPLPSGRYRIEFVDYRPDEKTWLILHRFVRRAEG